MSSSFSGNAAVRSSRALGSPSNSSVILSPIIVLISMPPERKFCDSSTVKPASSRDSNPRLVSERRAKGGKQGVERAMEHLDEQPLLCAEHPHDIGLADPGGSGDLSGCGADVAVVAEYPHRRAENQLAAFPGLHSGEGDRCTGLSEGHER